MNVKVACFGKFLLYYLPFLTDILSSPLSLSLLFTSIYYVSVNVLVSGGGDGRVRRGGGQFTQRKIVPTRSDTIC